jgi:hypothetical protein
LNRTPIQTDVFAALFDNAQKGSSPPRAPNRTGGFPASASYRSLKDFTVELAPLSVIAGGNGTGKSNAFRALGLLKAAATGRFAESLAAEGGLPGVLFAGRLARVIHKRIEQGMWNRIRAEIAHAAAAAHEVGKMLGGHVHRASLAAIGWANQSSTSSQSGFAVRLK